MRTISRVLVVGLLLPQAVLAWEGRVGGGTTSSALFNVPTGVHFALGLQNRIGQTALALRGELVVNQDRSGGAFIHRSFTSPGTAWVRSVQTSPSLRFGPAVVFQGRPDGRWSPYVIAGIAYHIGSYRHEAVSDGLVIDADTVSNRGFNTNYGAGLQANLGRATGFLEFRKSSANGSPFQLTLGVGL